MVALHTALDGNMALLKMDRSNQPMVAAGRSGRSARGRAGAGARLPAGSRTGCHRRRRRARRHGRRGADPVARDRGPTRCRARVQLREPPGPRLDGGPVTDLDGDVIGLVTDAYR